MTLLGTFRLCWMSLRRLGFYKKSLIRERRILMAALGKIPQEKSSLQLIRHQIALNLQCASLSRSFVRLFIRGFLKRATLKLSSITPTGAMSKRAALFYSGSRAQSKSQKLHANVNT